MVSQQHIVLGEVENAAKDLHQFANVLTGRLNKIRAQVQECAVVYSGLGSGAFQAAMDQWDVTAKAMRADVFELAAVVRGAGTEHGNQDAQTAKTYRLGR